MSNINVFLRENLAAVSAKNLHVAPNIPEKKLNNAVKSFDYAGSVAHVVALFDNTMFGSGKDGLLFTGEQLIYRPSFSDPVKINYAMIEAVTHEIEFTGSKNDKKVERVDIRQQGGGVVALKDLLECDYAELARVLQAATQSFEDFTEEAQFIAISEMSEALKTAYVKIIVNMAYANDGTIDQHEFAEILMLMTRLDLDSDSRLALRTYMSGAESLEPVQALIGALDAAVPAGQLRSVHVSLVKDLLNVHLSVGGKSLADFGFLREHRALLHVSDEEIDLALDVINNDRAMLKDDCTDDQIVAAIKVISAKAAAVGTPLAAVYLSGSVIGMSAAGMTSGLAALGMGGVLGMSSMATGIGVAILIGVGTYAGVRKLTGANELTRAKRRELMLHEIIKQTQRTLSLLIEDINYLTIRLNGLITTQGVQDEKIRKLTMLMAQMTAAGTVLANRSDEVQSSATKLRCAQYLDLDKLRTLTREPSKADFLDFISGYYEARDFQVEKDGEKQTVSRLVIKSGVTTRDLESLAKAFEVVGYFNVGDVLKGSALDVAGKAKDRLTGMFS